MRYSTILFDLDGTLTDPEEGICGSVMYALQKSGRPVGSIEQYHKYIGPPLLRSFEVYANATPEEAKELLDFYRERFSTVGLFENKVYPGIPELLRDLKAAGCTVVITTGKPTVFSERIIEHFHLSEYIDLVCGTPLAHVNVEKCETIMEALFKLGIKDKSSVVMIGDRSHDAIGAKMAKVDFIGVLYGYGSRFELEAEGADSLAETVEDLRSLLFAD